MEEREINWVSWGTRGWFDTETVRCLSSRLVNKGFVFTSYDQSQPLVIAQLRAASQNVHRVERVWLHQLDTNTTPDTNGTPSLWRVLSAICLLPSTHVSLKQDVIYWKLKDELAIDQEKAHVSGLFPTGIIITPSFTDVLCFLFFTFAGW